MTASEIPIRYTHGIATGCRANPCIRFSPLRLGASSGEPSDLSDPAAPGSPPSGADGGGPPDLHVAVALENWLVYVRDLLAEVQSKLERTPDSATEQERQELSNLLARLRECRARVPGPEMIRAWLRYLQASGK